VPDHLDDNRVFDLLQGGLTPAALARVHAHIGKCEACRELVTEAVKSSTELGTTAPGLQAPFGAIAVGDSGGRVVIRDGKLSRKPAREAAPPASMRRAPHDALTAGMIIADRYRLERRIGEGGWGVVWAATHTMMKREVALKFLKTGKPEAVKRFLREARVSAGLRHPSIVEVHDVFLMPHTDMPVMVMDLLEGESLGARLRRVGPMAPAEVAHLLLSVVSALRAAHEKGIVHRDLKPENVFLVPSPDGRETALVLDFGLAKLTASEGSMASTSRLTKSGVVLGTPHYLAPEQLNQDSAIGGAVDVWALGVVIYESIASMKPFEGRGLPHLFTQIASHHPRPLREAAEQAADVPESLSSLVGRMLDKSPQARPQLTEIHDVLAACART
jgi:eukaryotic-like serine/threonine-protein kinase